MQILLRVAINLFALALIGLGLQLLITRHFASGLPPVPATVHLSVLFVHLFAALMMVLGAGLLWKRSLPTCSLLLGLIYTGSALVLHGRAGAALLHNGSLRTGLFEALAIGAALLVLFAMEVRPSRSLAEAPVALGWLGLVLFAVSIAAFGEQHLQYAFFVAPLVPAWIPQHFFWVRFTGVCMLAAAVGLFFPPRAALSGTLLGAMFLLWFLLVHLPRIVVAPRHGAEWTAGLVALAMGSGAWIVAAGRGRRRGAR